MRPELIVWAASQLDYLDQHPERVAETYELDCPSLVTRAARSLGIDVETFMLAALGDKLYPVKA